MAANSEAPLGGTALDAEDLALLGVIVDTLLPRTATPGALDVGAVDFIQFVLRRGLDPQGQQAFKDGMRTLRLDSASRLPSGLGGASAQQRLAYVEALDVRLFSPGPPHTKTSLITAYAVIKRLSVIAYFTAEVAASKLLDVELYPGPFVGNEPVTEHSRTFYEDSFGVPLERPPGYLM